MSLRNLPSRPNLDHLKYQAKDLLNAHAGRDPAAATRIREAHPRFVDASDATIFDSELRLSDAQLIIAREYGFASWARLKAHVDASASIPQNRFVGDWTANLLKSKGHPSQDRIQGATLHVDVVDNKVTLTDLLVDAAGREEQHENKVQADGKEHPSDYGYVLVAKWIGADILETVVKKDRHEVARVKYEVSADGMTLTVSATSDAHNGYPAVEHVTAFDRR